MSNITVTPQGIHLLLEDTMGAKARYLAEIEKMYDAEKDLILKAGYYVMKKMLKDNIEELGRIAADVKQLIKD